MHVFIGGLGGCGKIVVSKILQSIGFIPGRPWMINKAHDSPVLIACYKAVLSGKAGPEQLKVEIDRIAGTVDGQIVLKTGISMLVPEHLHSAFPHSKFVLCVRHPINQICIDRNYDIEINRFLGFEGCSYKTMQTQTRAEFWAKAYYIALNSLPYHYGDDLLTIRLEDMCENTATTIQRLLDFVESTYRVDSIFYKVSKHRDYDIGYDTLKPDVIQDVIEITKDVRLRFGYND